MKKVISFSLWGNNPIYTKGAIRNADLALYIYPGWTCRYYVGKSTPASIICKLIKRKNTELIIMNEEGDWTGMFWRFLTASDPTIDISIIRDVDSRLNSREKAAVDEWEESDKSFHIMRDHPQHRIEIMGGMWGIKKGVLPDLYKEIDSYKKGDHWQVDQNFLRECVYKKIREDVFVHDEFFELCPFPTKRLGKEFVGMQYDENDNILYPDHMEMIP